MNSDIDARTTPYARARMVARHAAGVPVRRYQRERLPCELIHIDIEKLGRFARSGHRVAEGRRADLPIWIRRYNTHRNHYALNRRTPLQPSRT